ncbi:MAG: hypothetical protein P9M13_10080 [Candidatus Ancaeobacter aquaticus]|nr:hypothetical protein [Candidatus Ancaeobacter aquaticus]
MDKSSKSILKHLVSLSVSVVILFVLSSFTSTAGAKTLVENKTGKTGSKEWFAPKVKVKPTNRIDLAIKLYNEGKLNEALSIFEDIQRKDQQNYTVKRYIKNIIVEKRRAAARDQALVQKDMVLDVRRAWVPPQSNRGESTEDTSFGAKRAKSKERLIMEEKSQQIIPEINFNDARLSDVINYLSKMSGINIILDADLVAQGGRGKVEAIDEVGVGEEGRYEGAGSGGIASDRVTIHLKNLPLIEALKYILQSKGLKYRIDDYAILVSTPSRLENVEMETRYYHLSSGSGVFTSMSRKEVTDEGDEALLSRGTDAETSMTMKDVLEQSGVPFPPGSKIFLDQRTGTLIARNTPANLAIVEKILGALDVPPFQVAIEAKFVEVAEGVMQELGIEAFLNQNFNTNYKYRGTGTGTNLPGANNPSSAILSNTGPNSSNPNQDARFTDGLRFLRNMAIPGSAGGIYGSTGGIFSFATLSQPQMQFILHALDQCDVANVLSAPKVTTINNQQARIEVVTEVIYPSEFEITPPTTNNNGNVITPAVVIPSAFTTRDTGIILEVTPSVGADRKTINLTLIPEVSELASWMDYGIPATLNAAGNVIANAVPVLQPFFETRNVTTSVIINDGETVVLGGLIRDTTIRTNDKIPVLGDLPFIGRAFRVEAEISEKRNLLIFVTAHLLTPTGDRIRDPKLKKTKVFNP